MKLRKYKNEEYGDVILYERDEVKNLYKILFVDNNKYGYEKISGRNFFFKFSKNLYDGDFPSDSKKEFIKIIWRDGERL